MASQMVSDSSRPRARWRWPVPAAVQHGEAVRLVTSGIALASLALAGVFLEPGSCSQRQRCADFSSLRLSPGIASPRGTKEIGSFPH